MLAIAAQARRVVARARKTSYLAQISVAPGRKQGPGSQKVGLLHIIGQLPVQVLEILGETHPFLQKWLKDRNGAHDILGKGLACGGAAAKFQRVSVHMYIANPLLLHQARNLVKQAIVVWREEVAGLVKRLNEQVAYAVEGRAGA